MLTRGARLNPELMEQERQLGPEPSDADAPPPRRRRGAAANTQEESTESTEEVCVATWAVATQSLKGNGYKTVDVRCAGKKVCVLVAPAMDVRASMARDVQCKHVSNLHVSNLQPPHHAFCGSGESPSNLGHADCTMHPVVLVLDDPLDSLPARTSAEPSGNG